MKKERPTFKRQETDIPVQVTLWIDSRDLSKDQINYLKKLVQLQYDNAFFFEVRGNASELEILDGVDITKEPKLFGLSKVVD